MSDLQDKEKSEMTMRELLESMSDAELAESLCYLGQMVCSSDCEKERVAENCRECYYAWLGSEVPEMPND